MTYLRSIYVYNNFVDKNFEINFSPINGEPFRHLILTGNNGSGKTNTLQAINFELQKLLLCVFQPQIYYALKSIEQQVGVDLAKSDFDFDILKVALDFNPQNSEWAGMRNQVCLFFECFLFVCNFA